MTVYLLAINSKYIHSNPAVYSLRANAGEYMDSVVIGEFTINNLKEKILQSVYAAHPDVLCISVYIWNLKYVESISREFHKLCPNVPIWVGGPEVSFETRQFLIDNPQITGCMIGEGEKTFYEVLGHYIDQNAELSDIAGLAYRKETAESGRPLIQALGECTESVPSKVSDMPNDEISSVMNEIVFTAPREPADMNELKFAYGYGEDLTNRIVYYESSRGCPFSCSYCLSSVDKCVRFKNIELVQAELMTFIERRVPQVKFVDRTFNVNHKHAMEILRFIKDNDNGITNFHFEVAADLISDEEIKMMSDMRPGLIQLEIGVQSTNPETIKEIHRKMNLERLKEVVLKIQAFGNIHEHLDLIAGLPYEDLETFKKSFNEVYALKPDQLQLGFLKVLKGSYMSEHVGEYGIKYTDEPPYEVLATDWLSYEDIVLLKQVEDMVEVYYNSFQYEMTIKLLEVLFDTAFDMYEQLGQYYAEFGKGDASYSRIERSEMLLAFTERQNPSADVVEAIKQSLTYDLYLRENMKTRPGFAKDWSKWRDVTNRICEKGKLTHIEAIDYEFPTEMTGAVKCFPARLPKPMYYLFDYTERNQLNHQARVTVVEVGTDK